LSESEGQRIDKWLWHARFARTRTAAQRLVQAGDVRVNREKVAAASRLVRPGDVLTLATSREVRVLTVTAIAPRRGPAEAARLLYREHAAEPGPAPDPPTAPQARPESRQRRRIAALKRGPDA
jgi:ribosome-associated heat shock protein Hsp15